MISSSRSTLLVVSAILLGLQCADGALYEVSEKSARSARYIQFAPPNENSAAAPTDAKQYTNGGDYNGNYNDTNGNYYGNINNSNGINNAENSGNNAENIPIIEPSINNVSNNGNTLNTGLSVPPEQPPQNTGFSSLVSAFWDMFLSFVRGIMGLQRKEPPRIARAFIGAAAGKDECMRASVCHAGRMMRAFENNAVYFTVAELVVSDQWKAVVRRVRRATEDKENCNTYKCDV